MKNSIPEMRIILEHNNYNTKNQTEVKSMGKNKMSSKAARRIQSHSDKSSKNRKDRTGVIIAILLDLLELSRELIMEDYLLSYSNTKRYYIDLVLKVIDKEYGGTENFLVNH